MERGTDRPPFVFWTCLFLLGVILPLRIAIVEFMNTENGYLAIAGTSYGRDFTNVWIGGKLVLDGVNVYDNAVYLSELRQRGISALQYYLHPPHSLFLAASFSQLPYIVSLFAWTLLGWVMFYFAAKPYVRFHPLMTLLVPGVAAVPNGQYGVILGALWLWSFRGSGIASGLLTIKPHIGLFLAASLLAKGRWKQILIALLVAIVLLAASEFAFGLIGEFLTNGVAAQRAVLLDARDQPYFLGMPSTYARLRGSGLEWPLHFAAALLALALLWRLRRQDFRDLAFPAATATFVILPYAFDYDMTVASLGFAVLLYDNWARLRIWERLVATLAFWLPLAPWLPVAPLIFLAGLWVQVRLLESLPGVAQIFGAKAVRDEVGSEV